MKLVVQVRLLSTPEQAAALQATLRAANKAADLVSRITFQQRCFRNFDLRKHAYEQVKAVFGLAAQAAQHVIKKVCDAYRALHANLAAGHLGRPGSARRVKAGSKPISFRSLAAQPYDDRLLARFQPVAIRPAQRRAALMAGAGTSAECGRERAPRSFHRRWLTVPS
ncbi:hypothetical protein ACTMTI_27640 [Nonomuraea sp. H19]|uniref:hypothetical protein n=1 Tax=Nonomuraea sp. H19 TaxID=3452206 RepID=UPI003F8CA7F1